MNLKILEKDKFESKWWSLIGHHFDEQYMINIYYKLMEMSNKKHIILPKRDDIYKQFKYCKYDDVIVCFVVPKPIVEYDKNLCWQYMTTLLEVDCYKGLNLDCHDNMDYLLSQGVIHIPVSMTYSKHIHHTNLGWQTFTKDCIKHLSNSFNKILFIYEDSCMEMLEDVDFKRHQVELLEPGVFNKINQFCTKEYNIKIKW